MKNALRILLASFSLPAFMWTADVPNLSGDWVLKVERSTWNKVPKPSSVNVTIEHQEPQFKYTGSVSDQDGTNKSFSFEGAIDGKPHPVKGSAVGDGSITLKRVNAQILEYETKSEDGRYSERGRMVVSRDGKTLTRYMRVKGPDGEQSWTEVYERQ